MREKLLYLGVAVLPFYELIMASLPLKSINFVDSRVSKESLSLYIMIPFIIATLYKDGIKKFNNIWILCLFGCIWASYFFGPKIMLETTVGQMDSPWAFKGIAYFTVYFLFFLSLCTMEFNIKKLVDVLRWTCLIMAGYVILQAFGLDQFQSVNNENTDLKFLNAVLTGGNLGHPTLVAPFLAVGVFLSKNIKHLLICLVALFLTKSDVAIIACLITGIIYFMGFEWKNVIKVAVIILVFITGLWFYKKQVIINNSNGRIGVWVNIVKDLKTPLFKGQGYIYPITGKGIGSFQYIFPRMHNNRFNKAHNEPLQFLYECGLLGFYVYIMANIMAFSDIFKIKDDFYKKLIAILMLVTLCSLGTFVYHLAVYQFITCLILASLYQNKNKLETMRFK